VIGRGWQPTGRAFVLLRVGESHADRSTDVEVLAAEAGRPVHRIGAIPHAFFTTSRLDGAGSRLLVTRAEAGIHNAYAWALDTGRLSALTDNALAGVTFSGLQPAGPRLLLTVRDETRQDIWLSERDPAR
jgi:hypothetical protein